MPLVGSLRPSRCQIHPILAVPPRWGTLPCTITDRPSGNHGGPVDSRKLISRFSGNSCSPPVLSSLITRTLGERE